MLNKEQQQFLRQNLAKLIDQYEEYITTLSFYNFFKRSEYNSFIVRFKSLQIKLNDNEDVLKKMSLGEVATLRNISIENAKNIKKTANYKQNKDFMKEITIARECIIQTSKELEEIDNAQDSGPQPF